MSESAGGEGLALTLAEHQHLRAAFERDKWAGEWNSLPTAIDRVVEARAGAADTLRQAVEALLADLTRGNGLSLGGVSCGVCHGHSPSWDHHSRNCLNALPDRLRRVLDDTKDQP